jgi:molybdopterin synthase sulfur carrier subunit
MRIKVKFFATFREAFGVKEKDVTLPDGSTIGLLLETVADTPLRRAEVFDGPVLRPHLVVIVNGAGLTPGDGLAAPLRDGDVVAVFPMMGGG